jgi:hypothetical protein
METGIPPDIEGNGKNQDQAGDKDDFKKQGSLFYDGTHLRSGKYFVI